MAPHEQLNELSLELAAMMREYNALKSNLIKTIDEKGVDIGDGFIMTPDACDGFFIEAEALLVKITAKLIDAYCFCIKESIEVPDVIYIARQRLAEHQAFFDHLKHDCPKLH